MMRIAVLPATQCRRDRRADTGAHGHGEQQKPVFSIFFMRLTGSFKRARKRRGVNED
jgi:hypothetical protein